MRAEVGRGNSGVVHVVTLLDGSQYYVKTVCGGRGQISVLFIDFGGAVRSSSSSSVSDCGYRNNLQWLDCLFVRRC